MSIDGDVGESVSAATFDDERAFNTGHLTLLCFDVWAIIWKDVKRVEYQWEFAFNANKDLDTI